MKKIFIVATMLLCSFSCFASQYEYANDKYCVYKINVGDQTASVVNFYSEASVITIPASFIYQGDKYIVTELGYKDFETRVREDWFGNAVLESYGKYSYEDYEKNRACIVELNLPNTLKTISSDAFKGMTRLKKLIIPANVYTFSTYCFSGNSRLEAVTFEGFPHLCYSYYKRSRTGEERHELCLDDSTDPLSVIDSLKLKNEWKKYYCPKLETIQFTALKKYIELEKIHNAYSKQLQDSVSAYNDRLSQHPYYYAENYFTDIAIPKPSAGNKESLAVLTNVLKKQFNQQLKLCREEYIKLWENMEENCKQKSPETYAERYCANNPEFSAQIDTLLKDYKCEYTKQRLALCILKNYQLGEKCQDKLWKKYAYLFENKEAFLSTYYNSSNIKNVISMREETYHLFKYFIKKSINGKKMKLKGAYAMEGSIGREFCRNYDKMRDRGIPVSEEIINLDPKAQKEFIKNSQYFSNADDFFAAYIRPNYSDILKAKKKASK